MPKGRFIVIEGSDGSGKSTQFALIAEQLKAAGHDLVTYHFPQYTEESSYFVREYLAGNYGSAAELGAYTPSLFYALDRFQAAQRMKQELAEGKVILCDRFIGSNMGHQGQKIDSYEERKKYYDWLYQLEFEMLGIPKPDLNVVLLVPAETAKKLMDARGEHAFNKKDIHEADLGLLERSVATYRELCEKFSNFTAIECMKDGSLLSIEEVNGIIAEKLKPVLADI
jgi:dTMP kinase